MKVLRMDGYGWEIKNIPLPALADHDADIRAAPG
jgi:hypothetical protein